MPVRSATSVSVRRGCRASKASITPRPCSSDATKSRRASFMPMSSSHPSHKCALRTLDGNALTLVNTASENPFTRSKTECALRTRIRRQTMALRLNALLAAAATVLTALPAAHAQAPAGSFPQKPIRIIVPFPAGGTADAIPRIVAEKLTTKWGHQVIIDNKPGVGGNIGSLEAYRAAGDGYTLLASPPGPLAVNTSLYKQLAFEATNFVPISMLATMPNLLAVRNGLPVGSVQQLVDMAKREPGKISYASQGNGTTSHLTANLLQLRTGTELLHAPYKGTAPGLADLAGGQVDMMFDNVSSSLGQYKGGRIKVLAVATPQRLPSMPEVPTFTEAGLPNFRTGTWVALVAPPNTPPAIAAAIQQAVAEVVRLPDVRKRFADLGADAVGGSPDELKTFLAGESAHWKDVIQRAKVTVDN